MGGVDGNYEIIFAYLSVKRYVVAVLMRGNNSRCMSTPSCF